MRVALAALLLLLAAPASAACPDWLTADMAERGVPVFEIARMCGPAPVRSIAPQVEAAVTPARPAAPADGAARRQSNRCVPETGSACVTRSLRSIGSPCWCGDEGGRHAEGTIR